MDERNILGQWFAENGGYLNPQCEVVEREGYGLYVVARAKLSESDNAAICTCPAQLSLSYLNILSAEDPAYETSVRRIESEISQLFGQVSVQVLSYFLLIEQRLLGDRSFWKPYIDLLPKEDKLSTPLFFSDEDLKWIAGTNVYGAVSERRSAWQSDHKEACAFLDKHGIDASKYTWNLYLWAATIFSSRCFTSNVAFPQKPDVFPLLYPVLDIMNHGSKAKVTWDFQEGSFTVINNQPIQEGQEIFNNYGPKGNEELLMGYGFCIPDNPCDEVVLQAGAPPPVIYQKLRALNPDHFKSENWTTTEGTFRIRHQGHFGGKYDAPAACWQWIPPALFHLMLQLISINKSYSGTTNTSQSVEYPGRVVLAATCSVLKPLRIKYRSIIKAIEQCPSVPQNGRQRYAKIYRDKQAAILAQSVIHMEQVLAELYDKDHMTDHFTPIIQSVSRLVKMMDDRKSNSSIPAQRHFYGNCIDGLHALFGEVLDFTGSEDQAWILVLFYFLVSSETRDSIHPPEWITHCLKDLQEQHPVQIETTSEESDEAIDYFEMLIATAAEAVPESAWILDDHTRRRLAWAVQVVQDEVWEWRGASDDAENSRLVMYLRRFGEEETWLRS